MPACASSRAEDASKARSSSALNSGAGSKPLRALHGCISKTLSSGRQHHPVAGIPLPQRHLEPVSAERNLNLKSRSPVNCHHLLKLPRRLIRLRCRLLSLAICPGRWRRLLSLAARRRHPRRHLLNHHRYMPPHCRLHLWRRLNRQPQACQCRRFGCRFRRRFRRLVQRRCSGQQSNRRCRRRECKCWQSRRHRLNRQLPRELPSP